MHLQRRTQGHLALPQELSIRS
uniref:Uncharacterized protein n=1 Tax=Anguilla anguilla TaxID=7936 RepID=A0A0E9QAW1_ANGAN